MKIVIPLIKMYFLYLCRASLHCSQSPLELAGCNISRLKDIKKYKYMNSNNI